MNARKRLEKLEAETSTDSACESSLALDLYFKCLENERRKQAREPPLPLTPAEERYQGEMDNDPEFLAYMKRINQQREEQSE